MRPAAEQLEYLMRGVDTALPVGALEARLAEGKPLRVKLGVDPTAPDVHLGWGVVLGLLRRFQELGHTAVLIVGDFTAQVGDPSGRSETRKRLEADEVGSFASTCLDVIQELLLPENLEIRPNSEWLGKLSMHDILDLTSKFTVSRIMDRDDFTKRFAAQEPISLLEFMYPLLQGYDSVAVEADIELGGTDQLWNLLVGRELQERFGQQPQLVMTMPLLVGTDGSRKMSQSYGNYVSVRDEPADMFGKVMSIPDSAMGEWFLLAADMPADEVAVTTSGIESGSLHPGEVKRDLGRRIVARYWGESAAAEAEAAFDQVFKHHQTPDEIPEHPLPIDEDPVRLPAYLNAAGLVSSNSEARRLIQQGALKIDGTKFDQEEIPRAELVDVVIQVGKRRFVRPT
ncbi:MAG: tyrosine--tRNA ligase [Acidimicrobiia bacterium]|nr:tyrosine--tRNA ligase [Acidimicrobiia bacterium]